MEKGHDLWEKFLFLFNCDSLVNRHTTREFKKLTQEARWGSHSHKNSKIKFVLK